MHDTGESAPGQGCRMTNIVEFPRRPKPGLWPDHNADPLRPGLVIWNGIDKTTQDLVWVIDLVEANGEAFNIAVTSDFAKVAKYVSSYEPDGAGDLPV